MEKPTLILQEFELDQDRLTVVSDVPINISSRDVMLAGCGFPIPAAARLDKIEIYDRPDGSTQYRTSFLLVP